MKQYAFLLPCFLCSMVLNAQVSTWDGQTSTQWTHGSGTNENPYLIESAANLVYLSQKIGTYKTASFRQTIDIVLTSEFPIIGGFSGIYDGDGHTIEIDNHSSKCTQHDGLFDYRAGLFSTIENATIKNLHISGNFKSAGAAGSSVASGKGYFGSFAGESTKCTIQNCSSDVSFSPDTWRKGSLLTGGFVGYAKQTSFINCWFSGSINSRCYTVQDNAMLNGYGVYVTAGGIAGSMSDCNVEACENTGEIVAEANSKLSNTTSTDNTTCYTGGIAGYANKTTIHNCFNNALISSSAISEGWESSKNKITSSSGGIVGYTGTYTLTIDYCYNTGKIISIAKSKTTTTIEHQYAYSAGIAIGYANISNSYNTGTLNSTITQKGESVKGGISGKNSKTISNCYYLNTCGDNTSLGTSETSSFMKTQDFVDLLNADSTVYALDLNNINNGYPIYAKDAPPTRTQEGENSSEASLWVEDGNICIKSPKEIESITIYDTNGKTILNHRDRAFLYQIPCPWHNSTVYMIRLSYAGSAHYSTHKITVSQQH